jgi:hypothetical protein
MANMYEASCQHRGAQCKSATATCSKDIDMNSSPVIGTSTMQSATASFPPVADSPATFALRQQRFEPDGTSRREALEVGHLRGEGKPRAWQHPNARRNNRATLQRPASQSLRRWRRWRRLQQFRRPETHHVPVLKGNPRLVLDRLSDPRTKLQGILGLLGLAPLVLVGLPFDVSLTKGRFSRHSLARSSHCMTQTKKTWKIRPLKQVIESSGKNYA